MKFTQATLNQVAGFDAQVLAQNLIYNQKDFWNFSWSTIVNYAGGWTANTVPVDLVGATIDAQIIRRAITNYTDSRTGYDFQINDYPLVSLITTVTATTAPDLLTAVTTKDMFVGQPFNFVGDAFGDLFTSGVWYVHSIVDETTFRVALDPAGPSYNVQTATGLLKMNRVKPTPINLPITNRIDLAGTFTMTIDDDTWGLIAGDPDLNINAAEPACYTGRIKISFPAIGSQPAYDEAVFLLFLVNSDGVINNG